MNGRRRQIDGFCALASLCGSPMGFAQAQGAEENSLGRRLRYRRLQWIPWIAKDAKIYEKNGLDVEIILLRGSGQTSQAMIGGSIFASPVTTATLMPANSSGADLVNSGPYGCRGRAKCWSSRKSKSPRI